jgi:hypothetical protein
VPLWRLCTSIFGQHTCPWRWYLCLRYTFISWCAWLFLQGDHASVHGDCLSVFGDHVSLFSFGSWEPLVLLWRNFIWTCREIWRIGKDVNMCLRDIWFESRPVYQQPRPYFLIVSFLGREKDLARNSM